MRGIIEGMVGIIVLLLMLQILFPEILAQLVSTALTAVFVVILLFGVGVGVWLLTNLGNNGGGCV